MLRRFLSAAAAALVLAGCGGGGGASGGSATGALPAPAASPSVANAVATLAIAVPGTASSSTRGRGAAFVSFNTQSISIDVPLVNGTAPVPAVATVRADLNATNPNCSATPTGLTCAIPVNVPTGTVTFAVSTYATPSTNQTTAIGSVTVQQSVVANAQNRLTLAVSGIVAGLYLFLANPTVTAGTASSTTGIVTLVDATGAIIVAPGTYSPAISISTSDGTGAITFKVNNGAPAATATITQPSDTLTVLYNGATNFSVASITATAGSAANTTSIFSTSGNAFQVVPLQVQLASVTTGTGAFDLGGSVGLAFTGGNPAGYALGGSCGPYLTISQVSRSLFGLTAKAAGTCTLTLTDGTTTNTGAITVNPALALSATTLALTPGQTKTLTASGGSGTYPTAVSSNPAVAGVSIAGAAASVQGIGSGTATVTFADSLGSSVTANVTVTGNPLSYSGSPAPVSIAVPTANGTASVALSGGAGTYASVAGCPSFVTAATISGTTLQLTVPGSTPGGGSCTVTDSNGATLAVPLRALSATISPAAWAPSSVDVTQRTIVFPSSAPPSPGYATATLGGMGTYSATIDGIAGTVQISVNGGTTWVSTATGQTGTTLLIRPGGTPGFATVALRNADGSTLAIPVYTLSLTVPVQ